MAQNEIMKSLKNDIELNRLKMYEVANQIGISQWTLSIWMRSYDQDHYDQIIKAIDELTGGHHE